ncbi:MAG: hypothetical protein LIP02_08315 [Bacteroidales bacterium]|nr:hypothetical protein [Bacteroidales bacterium]
MKNLYLILFVFGLSCVWAGCTKEDYPLSDNSFDEKAFFDYVNAQKSTSIFQLLKEPSRVFDSINVNIPVFTPEDLEYLSSLSQNQLDSVILEFKVRLGSDPDSVMESREDSNVEYIMRVVGSQHGLTDYQNFVDAYFDTSGGLEQFQLLVPAGLNEDQKKLYEETAVYIDKCARAPYLAFIRNDLTTRASQGLCKFYAKIRLAICGVNLGASMMLNFCAGNLAAVIDALDCIEAAIGIIDTWYQYEICMGRWH